MTISEGYALGIGIKLLQRGVIHCILYTISFINSCVTLGGHFALEGFSEVNATDIHHMSSIQKVVLRVLCIALKLGPTTLLVNSERLVEQAEAVNGS